MSSNLNKVMQMFKEWMKQAAEHPFHQTAVRNGFQPEGSSSAAQTTTHTYSHPDGHTLSLHTNSKGHDMFRLNTKKGVAKTGDTAMQLHGAQCFKPNYKGSLSGWSQHFCRVMWNHKQCTVR